MRIEVLNIGPSRTPVRGLLGPGIDYLDFSLTRNTMIISKNVTYSNLNNTLEADVIELNIKTKDTKIFMHEKEKKVIIKSKN